MNRIIRVFIAKPVRGKINFKALRQRIIGRFPETIAYLAKWPSIGIET